MIEAGGQYLEITDDTIRALDLRIRLTLLPGTAASELDAMTVTGHKFGGPYGTGGLLLKRGIAMTPLTHGGGQEREVRSGTLDVPGVAGFATACRVAVQEQPQRAARVAALRDELVAG